MHCLVINDHPVTSLGLRMLITTNFSHWIVSTVTSLTEATKYIDASHDRPVSLVLLDIILHDQNGIAFLSKLHCPALAQPIFSIVISSEFDEEYIAFCKKLGVRGSISTKCELKEIVQTIHSVGLGDELFSSGNTKSTYTPVKNLPNLTNRQRDIVDLLLAGHSNKIIASTLNISYGTVKNYMFYLMRLLSVNSRLELVAKMREDGYMDFSDHTQRWSQ